MKSVVIIAVLFAAVICLVSANTLQPGYCNLPGSTRNEVFEANTYWYPEHKCVKYHCKPSGIVEESGCPVIPSPHSEDCLLIPKDNSATQQPICCDHLICYSRP